MAVLFKLLYFVCTGMFCVCVHENVRIIIYTMITGFREEYCYPRVLKVGESETICNVWRRDDLNIAGVFRILLFTESGYIFFFCLEVCMTLCRYGHNIEVSVLLNAITGANQKTLTLFA